MIQINLETIPAVLMTAAIIGGFGFIWKMYLTISKMSYMIGTMVPPTGIFATLVDLTSRTKILENQVDEQKEWMIRNGFDRRHQNTN